MVKDKSEKKDKKKVKEVTEAVTEVPEDVEMEDTDAVKVSGNVNHWCVTL